MSNGRHNNYIVDSSFVYVSYPSSFHEVVYIVIHFEKYTTTKSVSRTRWIREILLKRCVLHDMPLYEIKKFTHTNSFNAHAILFQSWSNSQNTRSTTTETHRDTIRCHRRFQEASVWYLHQKSLSEETYFLDVNFVEILDTIVWSYAHAFFIIWSLLKWKSNSLSHTYYPLIVVNIQRRRRSETRVRRCITWASCSMRYNSTHHHWTT